MSKKSKGELRAERRARRQRQQKQRAEQREAAKNAGAMVAEAKLGQAAAEARAERLAGSLASMTELAEAHLLRATAAEEQVKQIVAANVELERQLREAEKSAAVRAVAIDVLKESRQRLTDEVARYRAEDRNVAKLRRRLQEHGEQLEQARRERDQAMARVPPEPLRYGVPAESATATP